MAAFMIVVARVKQREAFLAAYALPAAELVARHGGRYLVRAPGAVALEGQYGAGASIVISEWPDRAAIERFWNCPDYQPLKAAREGLAEVDVLVIEQPD